MSEAHKYKWMWLVTVGYALVTLPLVLAGIFGSELAGLDPRFRQHLDQHAYRLEAAEKRMSRSEAAQNMMAGILRTMRRELTEAWYEEKEHDARIAELEKRHGALVTFVAKMGMQTNVHEQQLRNARREAQR